MYCTNCGKEIHDDAVICTACGVPTKNYNKIKEEPDDSMGCLMGGACFLIPFMGLMLYLFWKESKPNSSRFVAIWALIGFIVELVILIGFMIAVVVFQLNIFGFYYW
jgi:uncharacterized membrane protein YvbJ